MTNEERFEETFSEGEAPRLAVSNVRGSITVQSDRRDDIHVTAVKQTEGCSDPELTLVEIYQEGERVVAKTRYQEPHKRGKQVCPVD